MELTLRTQHGVRHGLAKKVEIPLRDLAREPLICFEPETPHGAMVSQLFEKERLPARVDFLIRHVETAVGLVANGVGIALLDEFSVVDAWELPISVVRIRTARCSICISAGTKTL
ncbi:LysR substrate-binding domain-containing protein [Bradyrhizobium sp. HKCCYLS1011]|uniref:LysR substrate-binding domain-containing protein n=1 Tax=Bradyrhizobium sp. HKCCYLS1011 TaxID=3420733 RepID=UPI003EBA0F59